MIVAPSSPQARFRAMGTDVHLSVAGSSALLAVGRRRIDELEDRWSRFRPTSELCRINAGAGAPVEVHPLTFALVERAVAAWHTTGGTFDPTVLFALRSAGYDRSFELLDAVDDRPPAAPVPTPGCAGIELDAARSTVCLPVGVGLDLGGIGKGFTADVVADELLAAGATGACVNLGGDVRVAGDPPWGDTWLVEVEPEPGLPEPDPPVVLSVVDGGIATTSSVRRRWTRGDRVLHHVIDPRTGAPVEQPPAAVTVVARGACRAEVVAKAALVAGPDALGAIERAGAAGLVVAADGTVGFAAGSEGFLR
jgi:thiamine biosynthesis lipoprotein